MCKYDASVYAPRCDVWGRGCLRFNLWLLGWKRSMPVGVLHSIIKIYNIKKRSVKTVDSYSHPESWSPPPRDVNLYGAGLCVVPPGQSDAGWLTAGLGWGRNVRPVPQRWGFTWLGATCCVSIYISQICCFTDEKIWVNSVQVGWQLLLLWGTWVVSHANTCLQPRLKNLPLKNRFTAS